MAQEQLRFNCMHFMPYMHLPENHKDFKTLLGGLLKQVSTTLRRATSSISDISLS